MTYFIRDSFANPLPIASIDAGVTQPNASSAAPTPPNYLGMIVKATDPTFGDGEFILLTGVASNAVGAAVIWDGTTYVPTLAPVTANMGRPVAFSMSAATAAQWGWYQIAGTAVALKSTSAKFLAKVALGVISTGKVGSVSSGKQILNARTANAATVVSATTTVNVVINRPGFMGRVT